MKTHKANQGQKSRLGSAMGLILVTTLYGCGGGGGESKNESTRTSAPNESSAELASEPTAISDETKTVETTTAAADHQAPENFSFSNYQRLLVSLSEANTELLTPGRQYVLKVSEPEGEVFLLTSVTYDKLYETPMSVPLALSSLVVEVFDVLAGELVLTQETVL
ncbi:hypothetical protein [Methylophaga sp.]|uniref:hypothetical protein n=1 Tax=Methylophaga sp. TaxID=2024840 RepID=UPI003A8CC3BD